MQVGKSNKSQLESKKVILIYYVGKLPIYTSYFLASCKSNRGYDFIIFNDNIETDSLENNVRFIKSNLADFNRCASEALGFKIQISRGYKICDFKPVFGVIFSDYIKGYDFWGICDLDIILGDVSAFLNEDLLATLDIFSSKPKWNSGSFSLFKNDEKVNNLFRLSEDWKEVFSSDHYFGFDESGNRWDGSPRTKDSGEILSLYDIIHLPESGVKCLYTDVVVEWPEDFTKLRWSKGHWTEVPTGKTFMYLHLLLMKNSWRFYQPPSLDFSRDIYVSRLGLSERDHTRFSPASVYWRFQRALNCIPGIYRSIKSKLK